MEEQIGKATTRKELCSEAVILRKNLFSSHNISFMYYLVILASLLLAGCFERQADDMDLLILTMNRDDLIKAADRSYEANHNSGALRLYTEFQKKYPSDSRKQDVIFKIALLHYANKDYQNASKAFADFLGVDPLHPLATQAKDYITSCKCELEKSETLENVNASQNIVEQKNSSEENI